MIWPDTCRGVFDRAKCAFAAVYLTIFLAAFSGPSIAFAAAPASSSVLPLNQSNVLLDLAQQTRQSLSEAGGPIATLTSEESGSVAGAPPGTQVYKNVIAGTPLVYRPGAGQRMADDMTLASGACTISYYTLRVAGLNQGGGATFGVETALWNGDPCQPGSSIIAGTQASFTGLANDTTVFDLEATLTPAVSVPGSTVWLAATFSINDAGWVRADRAEVGSTTNVWSENHVKLTPEDLPTGCGFFNFNSNGTPWAGFWAQINCNLQTTPTGACCNGITCTQTTQAACTTGVWQGAFTSCVPNVCLSGACCTGGTFATCTDTTQDQCSGGLFHPGGLCNQNACEPNFKVYENNVVTNIYDRIEAGVKWGDDLRLGTGAPCNLSAYDVLFAGDSGLGPATFNVHTELWTNNENGTPASEADDIPGVLIPGSGRDFTNVPANLFAQRLLAGPFTGVALPKKVWIVMNTNVTNAGPVTAGNASTGFSLDSFAKFNGPDGAGWLTGYWYGGHTPASCPGTSCVPAGSFRATVWCEGNPPTGACCNDSAGTCTEGVREIDCNGRWREAMSCAPETFDPPCGAGACCYPIGPQHIMLCENITYEDCQTREQPSAFKQGKFCEETQCPEYACLGHTGDCFSAHAGPGCEDAFCCDIVCDSMTGDPFCCSTDWDSTCAQFAQAQCERPLQNDNCADATLISGAGSFNFKNADATTDGPLHLDCKTLGGDEQITKDVWYCWTSPCNTQVLARTCNSTAVDTKIAVYDGCACPPTDAKLLDCDDDRCSFQSMAAFNAIAGQQYLIRVGSYPGEAGGEGLLTISCGPPNNLSCPATGDCCSGHAPSGACSNEVCCETVCLCDPFCCDTEWDDSCAGHGFNDSGCGAAELCKNICTPPCPTGSVTFVSPPSGMVDARIPHLPNNPTALRGVSALTVQAPAGSDRVDCWDLCETDVVAGSPNSIQSVVEQGRGQFLITLARPITQGAATTITFQGGGTMGTFISHPANVNSNTGANPADILDLIDNLNGILAIPLNPWQCDIDRSGICAPADIISEIDLLNGTNGFRTWNGTSKPVTAGLCP